MTEVVPMGTHWKPYLVERDVEKDRDVLHPLDLGDRVFTTREQMQDFFANLPKTHPWLVGRRIDFIEERNGT